MNSRRTLFLLLLAVAVAVWIYNSFILIKNVQSPVHLKPANKESPAIVKEFVYDKTLRDPFYCPAFMAEPAIIKRVVLTPKKVVNPPPFKIGGIVYDPANPAAILLNKGQSQIVKQGDMVDSALIKKIGADSVDIIYQGTRFRLGK